MNKGIKVVRENENTVDFELNVKPFIAVGLGYNERTRFKINALYEKYKSKAYPYMKNSEFRDAIMLNSGNIEGDLDSSQEIYGSDTFSIRFGGLINLQRLAGFDVKYRKKKYSKHELEKTLMRELESNGSLTRREVEENKNLPDIKTFYRYFKTTSFEKIKQEVLDKMNGDSWEFLF